MVVFLQKGIQSFKYTRGTNIIFQTLGLKDGDSRVQTRYLFVSFLRIKIELNNSNKSPHLVQQATLILSDRIRGTFGNSKLTDNRGTLFLLASLYPRFSRPLGTLIKGTRDRGQCLASGNTRTTRIRKKKKNEGTKTTRREKERKEEGRGNDRGRLRFSSFYEKFLSTFKFADTIPRRFRVTGETTAATLSLFLTRGRNFLPADSNRERRISLLNRELIAGIRAKRNGR